MEINNMETPDKEQDISITGPIHGNVIIYSRDEKVKELEAEIESLKNQLVEKDKLNLILDSKLQKNERGNK